MSRINTNVSSLIAQNILGWSNQALGQSLERLSTGLRINRGKDDPSGLIASENLRSDIVSVRAAITNGQRANQVIATADSALGEVSSLLNDIRGLVTESANSGALSDAQIEANQLQLDSSLEALNRIAQTTAFQGRKLLDGNLDFITDPVTNFGEITNLQIDQASLGSAGSVSVDVSVTTAATQAQVDVAIPVGVPAVQASDGTLTFQTAEVLSDMTNAGGSSISLPNAATAATSDVATLTGQDLAGTAGDITIAFADTATAGAETTVLAGGTLTVGIEAGVSTLTQVLAAINTHDEGVTAGADLNATLTVGVGTDVFAVADIAETGTLAGGVDAVDSLITIAPTTTGTTFNRAITFVSTVDEGAGLSTVTDDGTTLAISVDDDTAIDLATLATAIETALDANDDFTVTFTNTTGDGQFATTEDTDPTLLNVGATTTGTDFTGGLAQDVVFQLSGATGSDIFDFEAGSEIGVLVNAINLQKEATGIEAVANGTTLEFTSTAFGTNAFVDIQILDEDTGGTFKAVVGEQTRVTGDDVAASVNGVTANGDGNQLSINTATLDLALSVTADFTGSIAFDIDGGGALFQLGPDVVGNQQARLGIRSVNTARLGGVSGKLFELGTGKASSLANDPNTAALIVDEAIDQVTSLRGRLGAFQKTTVDTNIRSLNDTLVNLSDAESPIRDADFASETAALTRAQILVQSGTTVLSIANSNPQNVLALLR